MVLRNKGRTTIEILGWVFLHLDIYTSCLNAVGSTIFIKDICFYFVVISDIFNKNILRYCYAEIALTYDKQTSVSSQGAFDLKETGIK